MHNDQHAAAPEQIYFTPGSTDDTSTLSTITSISSTSNYKSLASVTNPSKSIVTMTSYKLRKYPIDTREITKPRGTKTKYEG